MPRYRIIKAQADLEEGVSALTRACPYMARVLADTGMPPLRRRANGFPGLARIIVGQQLSVASAGAIWGRTEALLKPFVPEDFLKLEADDLRACGLSAGKIRTLRVIATAIAEKEINLASLSRKDDEAIRERLIALKGIGPWTADIYIMFCLRRADGWAPGDLALRYAVRDAFDMEDIPGFAQMDEIAEIWRPWRSVAARALWAWYGMRRARKSADPL